MPGISVRSVLQPSSGGGSIVGESMDSGQDGVANFGVDDIARIKASAIDRVHQTMTHPGKMSLWDKTVGAICQQTQKIPLPAFAVRGMLLAPARVWRSAASQGHCGSL